MYCKKPGRDGNLMALPVKTFNLPVTSNDNLVYSIVKGYSNVINFTGILMVIPEKFTSNLLVN